MVRNSSPVPAATTIEFNAKPGSGGLQQKIVRKSTKQKLITKLQENN